MNGQILSVGKSSNADYNRIQQAVDDADDGDTVKVFSGEYQEQITIHDSIVLEANGEVILNGEGLGPETRGEVFGIKVGSGTRGIIIEQDTNVAPEIIGFTIRGYEVAIDGDKTNGSWCIRDVTLELNGDDGISAVESTGDWEVRDSVIRLNVEEGIDAGRTTGPWKVTNTIIERNGDDGIEADSSRTTSDWIVSNSEIRHNGHHGLELKESTGDWTIYNSRITNNESGVGAQRTSGNWVIEQSDLSNNRFVGVSGVHASGDWKINHTHIIKNSSGIWAPVASGDWKVVDSIIGETYFVPNDNAGEGTAIFVPKTSGKWAVRNCYLYDVCNFGIDATGSKEEGDAKGNKWGRKKEKVVSVGNIDCNDPCADIPMQCTDISNIGSTMESNPVDFLESVVGMSDSTIELADVAHLLVDHVNLFE